MAISSNYLKRDTFGDLKKNIFEKKKRGFIERLSFIFLIVIPKLTRRYYISA